MEPLKLPSEAEIRAATRQGEEAVVALVFAAFGKLAERIQQLEDQIGKEQQQQRETALQRWTGEEAKKLTP